MDYFVSLPVIIIDGPAAIHRVIYITEKKIKMNNETIFRIRIFVTGHVKPNSYVRFCTKFGHNKICKSI
jgi:hypothetical protein